MNNTPPQDVTDANRAIRARAGESPKSVDLPFWVDACIQLEPPRKPSGAVRAGRYCLYPVVRALLADRINARGDESVQLDRAALARWAGHSRPDNCRWIMAYLERIGLLEIHRHPSKDGQQPDTFDVFVEPPDNYVGPTSYAELDMALREGGPRSLFSAHPENRRSEPNPASEGVGGEPNPASEGVGPENRRSEPNPASKGSRARGIRIEGNSPEGEFPEGFEGNARASAADAATDDALETRPDLADLAARLPWRGDSLSLEEARSVVAAMARAQQVYGWTVERVQSEAVDALTRAKGDQVRYVVRRFKQGSQLGRFRLVPRPERVAEVTTSRSDAGRKEPVEDDEPELPPWCEECNTGGEPARGNPKLRYVETSTGREMCPCHPQHPSRKTA